MPSVVRPWATHVRVLQPENELHVPLLAAAYHWLRRCSSTVRWPTSVFREASALTLHSDTKHVLTRG